MESLKVMEGGRTEIIGTSLETTGRTTNLRMVEIKGV